MRTNDYEMRIVELETRVEKLKSLFSSEVARLARQIEACEEGMGYYIEQHGKEHCQLLRMVWPAYYKTCPEYHASVAEPESVLSKQPSGDLGQQS